MDETKPHLNAVPSLPQAIRRARVEAAEQSQVTAELRGAELARLEMLQDALKPVLAQVPAGLDLFDCGIMPGEHPRLFLDMIGFVEMARDRRTYRFLQDTRHGRVTLAESDRLDAMAEAAVSYIARRMLEREKALASDMTIEDAAKAYAEKSDDSPAAPAAVPAHPVAAARRVSRRRLRGFEGVVMFVIEFLGAAAFFALCAGAIYWAWTKVAPLALHGSLPPG